jgi:uncharacterized protein (TIGR02996 family)
MNDEAALLEAIQAAPGDPLPRLAYADWLEERADPRGELVRVEEEMRELPVFSERFWQLKPRRNELRAQAPPGWLEVMRYGADCQPTFRHGFPDGWKERWRLIREFTERWHRIPLPDVGGWAAEIERVEARLGRTFPPSLREWVAFAHDVQRASGSYEVFRDLYQMEELEGHAAISLLLQCEGDYHWAVRPADFALPDPPVWGFHLDRENGNEEVFVADEKGPLADSVTSFVLGYAMSYTDGEGGGFGTDVAEPTRLLHDLAAAFPVRARFGQEEVFEKENVLVRLGSSWWSSGKYLTVEVARPASRESVPAFLWDHTRNGGSFHGMFTSK